MAWTTAAALLAAALGAAISGGANPTSRAAAKDDGALRVHLPFPLTGPRDIRGNERSTRSYRAISPHAPQPISDVMARIIVSAASGLRGMETVIVRQPSAHNQLDVAAFDLAPAAHRSLLLISHEAIVPIPSGAAVEASAAGTDMRWDAQSMVPIAIMPLVLLAQARPPVARIPASGCSVFDSIGTFRVEPRDAIPAAGHARCTNSVPDRPLAASGAARSR